MRKTDTSHFDREGFSGDVYVTESDNKGFNALRVTVQQGHPKTEVTGMTRVYLVMEGEGTFTVNGIQEKVQKDDLYMINPGETYEYHGVMELFEFNIFSK